LTELGMGSSASMEKSKAVSSHRASIPRRVILCNARLAFIFLGLLRANQLKHPYQ
jgi:hypothetical protein